MAATMKTVFLQSVSHLKHGPKSSVAWKSSSLTLRTHSAPGLHVTTSAPHSSACNNSNSRCLLSTSTSSSAPVEAASTTINTEKPNNKNDSNVFLDNLGAFFLAGVAAIVASLIRSYLGSTNRNQMRDRLCEQAALDPLEIDDLRLANSELQLKEYREIAANVVRDLDGTATYQEFVACVRTTMARQKGEAFTIQLGHLLDRVAVEALKDKGQTTKEPMPIGFWLTVLALCLNAPVPERIRALFEVLEQTKQGDAVTVTDVRNLISYLQESCQLVPDSQVVASNDYIPVQKYDKGNSSNLFEWVGAEDDPVNIDIVSNILRSSAVCAWGECYHRKKHY